MTLPIMLWNVIECNILKNRLVCMTAIKHQEMYCILEMANEAEEYSRLKQVA